MGGGAYKRAGLIGGRGLLEGGAGQRRRGGVSVEGGEHGGRDMRSLFLGLD